LTKWEVAKIANYSPQLEIKMPAGCIKRNTETIRSNEKDVNQSRHIIWQRVEYLAEYMNLFSFSARLNVCLTNGYIYRIGK